MQAFAEGKAHGGFSNFALAYFSDILDRMPPRAMFFTFGDFATMNLWYLQQVTNKRPDVTVIHLSLLDVPWYTEWLYKKEPSLISKTVATDTIKYMEWTKKTYDVPIKNSKKKFEWTIEPLHYDKYVYRCDLVLIDIVRNNKFDRPIFLENGVDGEISAGLANYAASARGARRVYPEGNKYYTDDFFTTMGGLRAEMWKGLNKDCMEELRLANSVRYELLSAIYALYNADKPDEAKSMYAHMERIMPEKELPYDNDQALKGYMSKVKEMIGN